MLGRLSDFLRLVIAIRNRAMAIDDRLLLNLLSKQLLNQPQIKSQPGHNLNTISDIATLPSNNVLLFS
jgi:hypothetical protein